jgi:hypothetical protein
MSSCFCSGRPQHRPQGSGRGLVATLSPHPTLPLGAQALAQATGRKESAIKAEYGTSGDLGSVAAASRATQKTMFAPPPLTVAGVFKAFKEIAQEEGAKSQARPLGGWRGGSPSAARPACLPACLPAGKVLPSPDSQHPFLCTLWQGGMLIKALVAARVSPPAQPGSPIPPPLPFRSARRA